MSLEWLYGPVFSLVCINLAVAANADDGLDAVRQSVRDSVDPEQLGAGYAAIVSFAVSPDISTADYDLDDSSGTSAPQLDVYRLPLRHVFNEDGEGIKPFVQGILAYQELEAGFELAENEFIDSSWETYGASVAGGVEIPVTENLALLSALTLGYARLENNANYSGPVSEAIFKPVLKGLIFDWEADALIYGAAIGADYWKKASLGDIEARGSLAYSVIDTFDSSSDFVDFKSHVTSLDLELNTVYQTGTSVANRPLALVLLLGHTRFFGSNKDALGFEYFSEAGLALQFGGSAAHPNRRSWRVGLKSIFGDGVEGWSLVFSHGF